jgi:para-nitrobenzyl esterase
MRRRSEKLRCIGTGSLLCAFLAAAATAQSPPTPPGVELEGTSWQLVRIEAGDGKMRVPEDRSHYLLAFALHGELSARIDCNRGSGTWSSSEPGKLTFGELASTRAQCPPRSLYDEIVAQWAHVRSYALRDGHLFLSFTGDGGNTGIFEYEPLPVGGKAGTP